MEPEIRSEVLQNDVKITKDATSDVTGERTEYRFRRRGPSRENGGEAGETADERAVLEISEAAREGKVSMDINRISRRRLPMLAGGVLAGAITLSACGTSSSSPPPSTVLHRTLLQQGLSFYRGKTITFIAPDKPGGGFDQNTRVYAPYLGHYLHANVNVVNVPAGNTVAGQNQLASSKPNGLTVGWLNAGPDVEDTILGLPGLTFDPAKLDMLGGTAPTTDAVASLVSPTCNQWTSWATLVQNSSAQNPVTELIQTTGTTTFVLVLADGVFNVHATTIPGYASSADLLQGFLRGDGCVVIDPVSTIGPLVKAGEARPLLLNVKLQRSNVYVKYFAKTPTIAEAEQQFASSITTPLQKTGERALAGAALSARGFIAPNGTPAAQTAALTAAFRSASLNAGIQAQLINEGSPTGYQSPAIVRSTYASFLSAAKGVGAYLGPIKG